jgi:hypothetical protein
MDQNKTSQHTKILIRTNNKILTRTAIKTRSWLISSNQLKINLRTIGSKIITIPKVRIRINISLNL